MVAEPVAGLFLPVPALACPMSKDCPPDWLAVMPPMLIDSRELPWTPSPTCVLTAVSETQDVASLTNISPDIDPEKAPIPIPAPYTVMLADPVEARFAPFIPESWSAIENASDKLPAAIPAVSVIRLLAPTPWLATQYKVESLIQPVRSQADCPCEMVVVCITLPILAPKMLNCWSSDPNMADFVTLLAKTTSIDKLADFVPILIPAVSTTRVLLPIPPLMWQRVEESDCQVDCSDADQPPVEAVE